MAEPAIDISGVKFRWKPDLPDILSIDSFQIDTGARVFLRGPSGSGKTTLLNLLGGVASPQAGKIAVSGATITDMSAAARDRFRAAHVGFIFQLFNLVPYLGLIDNVTLPCRFSAARRARIDGALDDEAIRLLTHMQLDVGELASRPVAELSVGQQQRVAAARALIGRPELIIADEPTSSIDADARSAFLDLLFAEAAAVGATVLFVSHDTGLDEMFDRTVSLADINMAA